MGTGESAENPILLLILQVFTSSHRPLLYLLQPTSFRKTTFCQEQRLKRCLGFGFSSFGKRAQVITSLERPPVSQPAWPCGHGLLPSKISRDIVEMAKVDKAAESHRDELMKPVVVSFGILVSYHTVSYLPLSSPPISSPVLPASHHHLWGMKIK